MKDFKHNNSILIAMPGMQDPFFSRTVIYLQEYNSDGAFGFILNRPDQRTLNEAISIEGIEIPEHITTWFGGPVDTGVGVILSAKRNALGEICGINVGTERENVHELVVFQKNLLNETQNNPGSIFYPYEHRFVIGYSGWGSAQLDSEIKAGGWMQLEFDADLCCNTPWSNMWDKAIDRFGIDISALDVSSQSYLN
jgi:putative transcriptional regulator